MSTNSNDKTKHVYIYTTLINGECFFCPLFCTEYQKCCITKLQILNYTCKWQKNLAITTLKEKNRKSSTFTKYRIHKDQQCFKQIATYLSIFYWGLKLLYTIIICVIEMDNISLGLIPESWNIGNIGNNSNVQVRSCGETIWNGIKLYTYINQSFSLAT